MQRLFVYGTLAPGRPNEHVLSGLGGRWEPATMRGTLHPEGWGASMGYPGIALSESAGEVEGLLFTSERLEDFWAELDAFEGEAYQRLRGQARLEDGTRVEAWVYALKEG